MITAIENGTVVAFQDGSHRIVPRGTVVFNDDRISFVGQRFPEAVDRRVDATGRLIIPGFVNLHCHADTEAGGRLIADAGRRDFFHTGFLNYYAALQGTTPLPPRGRVAIGARFALVELLRSGCTTVVELGAATDEMVAIAGELGIRAYLGSQFRSCSHRVSPEGQLVYEWDEAGGLAGLERAKDFVRRHHGSHGDRIRGMLFPYQIDTCSPDLLRAARRAADELGVGMEIHVGQNLLEFHEVLRRHGKTQIELLADTGYLGPDAILGHCLLTTAHSLAALPGGRDLEILAASGASVAHCPLVFARRGNALESFHRYRAHGINVGLGTDTYPRDIISEMRLAALLCKVMEHDFFVASAADLFNAATLAGARALRRDDLGRLAPGARADIVVVDLRKIRIGPYRDPIKALVHCGTTDDVEHVFVDGRQVVTSGQVPGVDERALLADAQTEAERLWATVPEWHWQKLTADEMSPPSFPNLTGDLG
jgi:5-methylthioadenosine/S-adenosylhomocysteine deaminase